MCSYCGHRCRGRYDKQVCRVRDLSLAGWRIYLEYERWRVNCRGCGGVHVEHLDWLANNPLCLLFIHPRAPNLISLRSAGTMPV